jgi:hypothetical protein
MGFVGILYNITVMLAYLGLLRYQYVQLIDLNPDSDAAGFGTKIFGTICQNRLYK